MSGLLADDEINGLTHRIIGAAITVHRSLGPGMLESTYEVCLAAELRHRGLRVERQVAVPLVYRDVDIRCAYRMDLLVEETVAVELKVADKLHKRHVAQLVTYLRFADLRVGLLFNFNVPVLAAGGFKRILRPGGQAGLPAEPWLRGSASSPDS